MLQILRPRIGPTNQFNHSKNEQWNLGIVSWASDAHDNQPNLDLNRKCVLIQLAVS